MLAQIVLGEPLRGEHGSRAERGDACECAGHIPHGRLVGIDGLEIQSLEVRALVARAEHAVVPMHTDVRVAPLKILQVHVGIGVVIVLGVSGVHGASCGHAHPWRYGQRVRQMQHRVDTEEDVGIQHENKRRGYNVRQCHGHDGISAEGHSLTPRRCTVTALLDVWQVLGHQHRIALLSHTPEEMPRVVLGVVFVEVEPRTHVQKFKGPLEHVKDGRERGLDVRLVVPEQHEHRNDVCLGFCQGPSLTLEQLQDAAVNVDIGLLDKGLYFDLIWFNP